MIAGLIDIDLDDRVIHTHRDSYLIDTLSVVSVRRPLLPAGLLTGAGLAGFGLAFGDLLYPGEIAAAIVTGVAALTAGIQVGQLRLLSRDLRGSELSGVIWGRYRDLNAKRLDIARAIRGKAKGEAAA